MAKLEAFLAVEASLAAAIERPWAKIAQTVGSGLEAALETGDFATAHQLVDGLSLIGCCDSARLEELSISAWLLGAARILPVAALSGPLGAELLPPFLADVVAQLVLMVEDDAAQSLRALASALVVEAEEEANRRCWWSRRRARPRESPS
jgi:hypothetical protein